MNSGSGIHLVIMQKETRMKKRKDVAFGCLIMIAALLIFAAPVVAKATKTEFKATIEEFIFQGVPERQWIDGEGILHIRGLPLERRVDGDFVGTQTIVQNLNMDTATGTGNAWGTVILYVTWDGLTGTFESHYVGTITPTDGASFKVNGHGTGDFEGMKMRADFWSIGNNRAALEGIVLNPHGE